MITDNKMLPALDEDTPWIVVGNEVTSDFLPGGVITIMPQSPSFNTVDSVSGFAAS